MGNNKFNDESRDAFVSSHFAPVAGQGKKLSAKFAPKGREKFSYVRRVYGRRIPILSRL